MDMLKGLFVIILMFIVGIGAMWISGCMPPEGLALDNNDDEIVELLEEQNQLLEDILIELHDINRDKRW